MGAFANVSGMRHDFVLRQLAESTRQQTCARYRAPGDRVSATRRALALLLPRRCFCGVLKFLETNPEYPAQRLHNTAADRQHEWKA